MKCEGLKELLSVIKEDEGYLALWELDSRLMVVGFEYQSSDLKSLLALGERVYLLAYQNSWGESQVHCPASSVTTCDPPSRSVDI